MPWEIPSQTRSVSAFPGAYPILTVLLRRMICNHLHRSRPEKILNVFLRIHLRFFRACGLASVRTSFALLRPAMLDRLPLAKPRRGPAPPVTSAPARSYHVIIVNSECRHFLFVRIYGGKDS